MDGVDTGRGKLAVHRHDEADCHAHSSAGAPGGVTFSQILSQSRVEGALVRRLGDLDSPGDLAFEYEIARCIGHIGLLVAENHVAQNFGVER